MTVPIIVERAIERLRYVSPAKQQAAALVVLGLFALGTVVVSLAGN